MTISSVEKTHAIMSAHAKLSVQTKCSFFEGPPRSTAKLRTHEELKQKVIDARQERSSAYLRVLHKLMDGAVHKPGKLKSGQLPKRPAEEEKKDVPSRPKMQFTDFEIIQTLGRGAFGRVFLAKIKGDKTNTPYAIKRLKKGNIIQSSQVDRMTMEKTVLATLDHPFIVRLHSSFQDPKYLYLAMDFVVGGEFFQHLRTCRRFDDITARFYLAQVIMAIEHIHEKRFVYRDLKPENILVQADGYLKLVDFGLAKHIDHRTYTICGTPHYFAPEILLARGYGRSVDWWTVGVLMFEMLAGYPPFYADQPNDQPNAIYRCILGGKLHFPAHVESKARFVIKKLMNPNPNLRFGMLKGGVEEIKNTTYFRQVPFDDILNKKIIAPYKPTVKAPDDVTHFTNHPASEDDPPCIPSADDPFHDW